MSFSIFKFISINSDNKTNVVRNKNKIKVTFNLNIKSFTIRAKVYNKFMKVMKNSDNYEFNYELTDNDPDGLIPFKIIVYENKTKKKFEAVDTTDGSKIYLYKNNIKLNSIKYFTSNKTSNKHINLYDDIILDLDFSNNINLNCKICNKNVDIENIDCGKYRCKLHIDNMSILKDNLYELTYVDYYSNNKLYLKLDESELIFDNEEILLSENKHIGLSYSSSPLLEIESSCDGFIKFNKNVKYNLKNIKKGRNFIRFDNLNDGRYNLLMTVTNYKGYSNSLKIKEFVIKSNEIIPEIILSTISSSNTNKNIAFSGDKVVLSLTANKKINIPEVNFKINGIEIKSKVLIKDKFNQMIWDVYFYISDDINTGILSFNIHISDFNNYKNKAINTIDRSKILVFSNSVFKKNLNTFNKKISLLQNKMSEISNSDMDEYSNFIDNLIIPKTKYYLLQKKVNDNWENVKISNSDNFNSNEYELNIEYRCKIFFIDETGVQTKFTNIFIPKKC